MSLHAPKQPAPSPPGSTGFWYPVDESGPGAAVEVLRAVRRFRVADLAMRNRARTDMDMNDSDLVALRHLIAAGERHESIGPKDLSRHLGISSAATAKLLTRLENAGRLRREPHPRDRRAQVLHATVSAHAEVRQALGSAHRRMLEAAEKLNLSEQRAVVRFLDELSGAMAEPAEEPDAQAHAAPTAGHAPTDTAAPTQAPTAEAAPAEAAHTDDALAQTAHAPAPHNPNPPKD